MNFGFNTGVCRRVWQFTLLDTLLVAHALDDPSWVKLISTCRSCPEIRHILCTGRTLQETNRSFFSSTPLNRSFKLPERSKKDTRFATLGINSCQGGLRCSNTAKTTKLVPVVLFRQMPLLAGDSASPVATAGRPLGGRGRCVAFPRREHGARRKHCFIVKAALGNGSRGGPFDRSSPHHQQQESMLHALSSPERVGAEYGEVGVRSIRNFLCSVGCQGLHLWDAFPTSLITVAWGKECNAGPRPSTMWMRRPLPRTPCSHLLSWADLPCWQGFIQFRLSGEQIHLDVEKLNEQLRIYGADRMRHSMCPDEAFGLIFNLDNVVADTRSLQLAAWQQVALQEGLPFSAQRQHIFDMRPERAVTEVGTTMGRGARVKAAGGRAGGGP